MFGTVMADGAPISTSKYYNKTAFLLLTQLFYICEMRWGTDDKLLVGKHVEPVTVAERSKACTVFARSKAGIVDSNPTQGMDV
jgi:hypothetical protein